MAEIRIRDLDDSILAQEVAKAIALNGECRIEQVTVREVRRHPTPHSIWAHCPLTATRKIAQHDRIVIEWSSSRVDILPSRRLQCFKCLRVGHVKSRCRTAANRSGRCFTCEENSHMTRSCKSPFRCPTCHDLGARSSHRLGSENCNLPGNHTGKKGWNGGK